MAQQPPLSQEQLKQFAAAAPFPTALLYKNGIIFFANQAFARALGQSINSLIGMSLVDFFIEAESREAVLQALLQGSQISDLEIQVQKDSGSPIWIQLSLARHFISVPELFLVQFSHISHFKKTETALYKHARSLEALMKLAHEVNSTLDLERVLQTAVSFMVQLLGVTSAYINAWDDKEESLTVLAEYYSPEASAAERVSDLGAAYSLDLFEITSEWIYNFKNYYLAHIDDPELQDYEREHMALYGGKSVLEVPLNVKDKPIGTLELWESRQKREFTQAEIEFLHAIAYQVAMAIENARLYTAVEETNRLKTEFLANVSHELRTPLGVILGYAEMMDDGLYGTLSPAQKNALSHIVESTDILTNQVNDLLDAARLEVGKIQLDNGMILLEDIFDWIKRKFTDQADMKGLLFEIDVAADVPPTIVGDWTRLRQILQNVITNALKFTNEGQVSLKIYCPQEGYWAISISDTGPGIPPDTQAFIFEPFRQVNNEITRKHSGTGLGLSISSQLVQLMGGDISLQSQVGEGSTFTIVLPIQPHTP